MAPKAVGSGKPLDLRSIDSETTQVAVAGCLRCEAREALPRIRAYRLTSGTGSGRTLLDESRALRLLPGGLSRMARVHDVFDDDYSQSLRDAIALNTLLADAVESGSSWVEALTFARARLAEQGECLVMAEAHLLVQALKALRDLVNQLPDDVDLVGIHRPATILSLLSQCGADAARSEDDDRP